MGLFDFFKKYDENGFDKQGIHKNGTKFNDLGFDVNGFNILGYDRDGFDNSGYNKKGFDKLGFDKNGFNKLGYDKDGFNKKGFNKKGFNRKGFNAKGIHLNGAKYDDEGYTYDGFNKVGIHKNGTKYNIHGYDKNGYDRNGFNKQKIHKNGTRSSNKNSKVIIASNISYNKDEFDINGFNSKGIHLNGTKYDNNGYDKSGYDKYGYHKSGYNRFGYDRNGFTRSGIHRNGTKYNSKGLDVNGNPKPISTYKNTPSSINCKINWDEDGALDGIKKAIITKVVGVTIGDRQNSVKVCRSGEELQLKREPFNEADKNAIAVLNKNGVKLGYLSKELAPTLAKKMDNGLKIFCKVIKVTGGGDLNYGLNISIYDSNTDLSLIKEESKSSNTLTMNTIVDFKLKNSIERVVLEDLYDEAAHGTVEDFFGFVNAWIKTGRASVVNNMNYNSIADYDKATKELNFISFVKKYSKNELEKLINDNYELNVYWFRTRPAFGFNGVYEYVAALLLSKFDTSTADNFKQLIESRFKKEITSSLVLSDYFDSVVNKSKVPYETWSEVWRYLKNTHKWIENTTAATGIRSREKYKLTFVEMYKKYNFFHKSFMMTHNLTDENLEEGTIWLAELYLKDFLEKKDVDIFDLRLVVMHLQRNNLTNIQSSKYVSVREIVEKYNFEHPDFDEDLLYRLEVK